MINTPQTPPSTVGWQPLPGSQSLAMACPCDEILYHGTRGPGKTEWQLAAFCKNVGVGYGEKWTGVIFDRGYKNLEDIVSKAMVMIPKIFPAAKWKGSKSEYYWQFTTGERLYFRHIKRAEDYRDYHGHEYPFIGFNELTSYPTSELYDSMKSCNRSGFSPIDHSPKLTPEDRRIIDECDMLGEPIPKKVKKRIMSDIPLVMCSTTNPHGPGHNWVKKRWIDKAPPGVPIKTVARVFNPRTGEDENIETTIVHIFGSYRENRFLDPKYVAFLNGIKDPNKRRAWLGGDWSITSGGALDDLWNAGVHVLPRFIIPKEWRLTRSFDWGSTHPFSVGFWAIANGEEVILPNGDRFCPPAGSRIRFNEIYGAELVNDGSGRMVPAYETNKGLRISAREVARQTRELEEEMIEDGWIEGNVQPGPADGQIFNKDPNLKDKTKDDSDSIAKLMEAEGIIWTRADKSAGTRKMGLEMMRVALENASQGEGAGLYVMNNCHAFLETVPSIPRDEDNPDDVDTTSVDHCFIAGTMIQTPDGEQPIESIKIGDMVETRFGAFPVVDVHVTPNQEVISNVGLTGTPGHKVWTHNGIKELDSLMQSDILHTWTFQKTMNVLNSTVLSFVDTPIHPGEKLGYISCLMALIERTVLEDCTKKFTDIFTVQFLKVITSITKTETLSTMTHQTLKQLQQNNTSDCTFLNELKKCVNTRREFARCLKHGIQALKEKNGIQNMLNGTLKRWNQNVLNAHNARLNSGQNPLVNTSFVPTNAKQNTAICPGSIISQENVQCVKQNSPSTNTQRKERVQGHAVENTRQETVINLTVSGPSEYFANGVLVQNCYDEARYMILDDKPLFAGSVDVDIAQ